MKGKLKKFLSVVIHQLITFHKVTITNSGRINEWIPVTKIKCKDCGKLFYELKK